MRVGSLFSGIGAFDLGFERAGMQVVWQCEIDAACQTVLRRHWPGVRMYDDVRAVGADAGAVDVICGGFPCQDVSVAGRRAGLAGERSGLWFEFHRVLRDVRPDWVVIENVPGLLSSNKGRDFGAILTGLVELGYGVCWRVLDSQYFGVAQRRRRVFVVGHLGDGRAAEVLFEREGVCGHPPTRGKAREGATPILEAGARTGSGGSGRNGGGIGAAGDPMFTLQAAHQHAVAPPLTGNGVGAGRTGNERNEVDFCIPVAKPLGHNTGGSRQDLDNDTYVTHALTAEGADASEDGTGRGTPLVAACLQERDAKGPKPDTKPGHLITTPAVAIRTANTGANGHGVAEDVTHTLDGAQGQAVAFDTTQVTSPGNYSQPKPGDPCHPLSESAHAPAVAFAQNTRDEVRQVNGDGSITGALAAQPGMKQTSYVATSTVRRLTPVECERLQAFPDGWTAEGWERRTVWSQPEFLGGDAEEAGSIVIPMSDSARYRQLGNAVTVNVAEWIGRRIMEVER